MKKNILVKAKNIYLVGIKGVGMTALAQILQNSGKEISGSDTKEKFFTDNVLKKLGIFFKEGFKATNIPDNTELVIYSTAFNPADHPELQAAQRKKIPVLSYPQAVSSLFNSSFGIAISGTHGKTTTAALIAESMKGLGLKPTALVGSRVSSWKTNALTGNSPYFVIEADEHQNKLKFYDPWSIVLTNIDYDHPDFYKKESDYYTAFKDWVKKWYEAKTCCDQPLPKIGVFNGDDSKTKRLIKELKLKSSADCLILTYGKEKNNNIRIANYESQTTNNYKAINKLTIKINIPGYKSKTTHVTASLIGQHNAYNLAAAYAFIFALTRWGMSLKSISDRKIAESFTAFTGTERRLQYKGQRGNVWVFDDYAHHPTEIRASLSALKKTYPEYFLVAVFQPHTFTRTVAFLKDFAKSLELADLVCLLEIYGSARESDGRVSSNDIVRAINQKNCKYFPTHKDCLDFLNRNKFPQPTILVTIGAGDGWRVGENFLKF